MSADIKENDNASITYETISDYVDALKKLFVLEDMPAWNPKLRSKAAIQSSDTRYFVDPSIATSALSLGPKDLIKIYEHSAYILSQWRWETYSLMLMPSAETYTTTEIPPDWNAMLSYTEEMVIMDLLRLSLESGTFWCLEIIQKGWPIDFDHPFRQAVGDLTFVRQAKAGPTVH